MSKVELIFLLLTITSYFSSIFLVIFYPSVVNTFRRNWFLIFGVIFHLWTIVIRWEMTAHPPLMGTYETTLGGSFVLVISGILLSREYRDLILSHIIINFLTILLLLYGLAFHVGYSPLTISEQGILVEIHVFFAWLALSFYSLSFALSISLIKKRGEDFMLEKLLEETIFYFFCLGFAFLTAMICTGSYYGFVLMGKWWRWDPVEILALIFWVSSGLVIHIKLFYFWSGRRFTILVVIAFLLMIILYKVFPLVPKSLTFHNFDLKL